VGRRGESEGEAEILGAKDELFLGKKLIFHRKCLLDETSEAKPIVPVLEKK